ncbi:MAG: site-specific integrase [Oscillospiraceae bacterium]|nr:site-specific integrase [Oscillospiraceae bacterium]
MAKKNAKGSGTIRKKTVTRNGKQYTYWEARITTGRDPGTGRQIQRSFTGPTQKAVREKMQAAAVAVNTGTYTTPQRMTVGEWLDIWQRDYLGSLKPCTVRTYKGAVENHVKPALGAVKLVELHPHMVQGFINGLELAPSSVRLVYQVLHTALEKAVRLDYIPKNPTYNCELPRRDREEIHPLDDQQVARLMEAAKGTKLENLISVALFTGMRQSELLGLTWDAVDFDSSTINVNKQLSRAEHRQRSGLFVSTKSGKIRTITAAPLVMRFLRAQRRRQIEMQLKAGPVWDNPFGLVFTMPDGRPMDQRNVDYHFRRITAAAGLEGVRFHDTRHTYAVNAIRAGDDIKTVQGNLGHATAAFTLDRYAHFTEAMQKDSAARMESFAKAVLNL